MSPLTARCAVGYEQVAGKTILQFELHLKHPASCATYLYSSLAPVMCKSSKQSRIKKHALKVIISKRFEWGERNRIALHN
jgi:hypothetical protein